MARLTKELIEKDGIQSRKLAFKRLFKGGKTHPGTASEADTMSHMVRRVQIVSTKAVLSAHHFLVFQVFALDSDHARSHRCLKYRSGAADCHSQTDIGILYIDMPIISMTRFSVLMPHCRHSLQRRRRIGCQPSSSVQPCLDLSGHALALLWVRVSYSWPGEVSCMP